jgi:hypothetical protein
MSIKKFSGRREEMFFADKEKKDKKKQPIP